MNNCYLKCPMCGSRFDEYCLCSNPPQFEGSCSEGCFSLKYYQREDPYSHMSQEELDECRPL